jgi:hypothetical protein
MTQIFGKNAVVSQESTQDHPTQMGCRVHKPTHRPGNITRLCHHGSGKQLKSPSLKSLGRMQLLARNQLKKVTQSRWDVEFTSQLIDPETSHACVITDLANIGRVAYDRPTGFLANRESTW